MDATRRVRACPSCHSMNREDSRFCHECGASLANQPAVPVSELPTLAMQPVSPTPPLPDAQRLEEAAPPAEPVSEPPATPAQAAGRRSWRLPLLVGGGCLAAIVLVACGGLLAFLYASRTMVPAPVPAPTAIGGLTVTEVTTEIPVEPATSTVEPEAATEAPTAVDEPTVTPGVQTDEIATALAQSETATAAPQPDEPTAAPAEPTQPPANDNGVITTFEPGQADQLRANHDAVVASYQQKLFETFDQGLRTKRRWTQVNTDEGARTLVNNRYEITMKQPRLANSDTWSELVGTSYTVEATVRFPRLDLPAMAGIVFDAQQNDEQAMLFVMTNTGEWRLYQNLSLFASGQLPPQFVMAAETDYSLWVLRQPDHTELYFNAMPVAIVPAGPNAGGKIGVVGVSTGNETDVPVTVYLDNLLVKEP